MLDTDDWNNLDHRKFLIYGSTFTVSVDFLLYPLELLKTRVQLETKAKATLLDASVRAARGVIQSTGIRGFWKGFPLYTLGGLPSQGAYFFGYTWASHQLKKLNESRPEANQFPLFTIDAAAGFFADILAAPLWTPTEVIATRMQIQGPGVIKYNSTLHAFQHILSTEGIAGLFRGLSVSILAFGPASAIWWSLYQSTNRYLTATVQTYRIQQQQQQNSSEEKGTSLVSSPSEKPIITEHEPWIDGLSGLLAGTVSSVITNPLDIAKTRLQTQHSLLQEYDIEHYPKAALPKPNNSAILANSTGKILKPIVSTVASSSSSSVSSASTGTVISQSFSSTVIHPHPSGTINTASSTISTIAQALQRGIPIMKSTIATHVAQHIKQTSVEFNRYTILIKNSSNNNNNNKSSENTATKMIPKGGTVNVASNTLSIPTGKSSSITEPLIPSVGGAPFRTSISNDPRNIEVIAANTRAEVENALAQQQRTLNKVNIAKPTTIVSTSTTTVVPPTTGTTPSVSPHPPTSSLSSTTTITNILNTAHSSSTSGLPSSPSSVTAGVPHSSPSSSTVIGSVSSTTTTTTTMIRKPTSTTTGLSKLRKQRNKPISLALSGHLKHPSAVSHASSASSSATPKSANGILLHKGMFSVLVHILRTDGPRALIRGVLPRMMLQGPASAATFICYEQVKKLARKTERDLD